MSRKQSGNRARTLAWTSKRVETIAGSKQNTTRTANIIFLEGSGVEVVATAAWSKREAESMWEISARGGKNNLPTPNRASHNLVQQQHPQQKHHAGRNKA